MSINYQALTLGDCELYLNDQYLGLATGLTLCQLVERLPIERSVSGELAAQHLVPIRRAFSVEARLKEFSPVAFSFFANGGTSIGLAVANLGVTDFVRLYEGRPTRLRFLPGSPPMVKRSEERRGG